MVAWSMKHAAKGIAPKTGFYGETFGHDTWRHEFAGKTLAGGFRCLTKTKVVFFLPKFGPDPKKRLCIIMYYLYWVFSFEIQLPQGYLLLLEGGFEGEARGAQLQPMVPMY